MALVAAMLTAFYMTRLMVMTFHGENRSGDAERKHLREVPWVMAAPLVILAVLSLSGGWVNVNQAIAAVPVLSWIPHSEWLHEWLHAVTAPADAVLLAQVGEPSHAAPFFGGGEAVWAIVALAIAVGVVTATARALSRRRFAPAVEAQPATGFARVLENKWYVDEIYDALIVRPVVQGSKALWRFVDVRIIDGAVNGVAYLLRGLGWAGARLQTGQINAYAFAVVIGMLILLGFVAF